MLAHLVTGFFGALAVVAGAVTTAVARRGPNYPHNLATLYPDENAAARERAEARYTGAIAIGIAVTATAAAIAWGATAA